MNEDIAAFIINGQSVKLIRWVERMPRSSLAEKTGIPVWKLSLYEQGKKKLSFFDVVKILEALNVNVTDWGPIQGEIDRAIYRDRRFGKQPDE